MFRNTQLLSEGNMFQASKSICDDILMILMFIIFICFSVGLL